jgi:hypothetical protein
MALIFFQRAAGAILLGLACQAGAKDLSVEDARQAIAKADLLRQPEGSLELKATIATMQNGQELDSDAYAIQSDGGGNALLTMLAKDKRGQKVLSTNQGVWIYFPKTRRPIRLTPMQQLHGNASVGDILHVRWSSEYAVQSVDKDTQAVDGEPCKLIRLAAAREDAPYARIDLYVNEGKLEPVKALLYTFGGKLLKSATFSEPALINGRRMIGKTTIRSTIERNGKETVFRVGAVNQIKVNSEQFTLHALEVGQ